jgi:hypothetical protein
MFAYLFVSLWNNREYWGILEALSAKYQRSSIGCSGIARVQLEACSKCPPAYSQCANPHVCQVLAEEEEEMPRENLRKLLEAFETADDTVLALKHMSVK